MVATTPIEKKEKNEKVKKTKKNFKRKKQNVGISTEGGLDASVLNNEIVLMRKSVKKGYPRLLKRLGFCINNPEKCVKEGQPEISDEEEKAKIKKMAQEELDLLKSKAISLDEISKFALINKKKENQFEMTDSTPTTERVLKKLASQTSIVMHVKEFRRKYKNWEVQVPFLLQRLGIQYQANKHSKVNRKNKAKEKSDEHDENSKKNLLARIQSKTESMKTAELNDEDTEGEKSETGDVERTALDSDGNESKDEEIVNEDEQNQLPMLTKKKADKMKEKSKDSKSLEKDAVKAAVRIILRKENSKAIRGGKKLISQKQERKVNKAVDISSFADLSAAPLKKVEGESLIRRVNLSADEDLEDELEKERADKSNEKSDEPKKEEQDMTEATEVESCDRFFITQGAENIGYTGADENDDDYTTEKRLKKRADNFEKLREGKKLIDKRSGANGLQVNNRRHVPPTNYKSPWRGAGPREKHAPWRGQDERGFGDSRKGSHKSFSKRGAPRPGFNGERSTYPLRRGIKTERDGASTQETSSQKKPAETSAELEQLHPSWIAKKKLKETLAAKSTGKRIVFDD